MGRGGRGVQICFAVTVVTASCLVYAQSASWGWFPTLVKCVCKGCALRTQLLTQINSKQVDLLAFLLGLNLYLGQEIDLGVYYLFTLSAQYISSCATLLPPLPLSLPWTSPLTPIWEQCIVCQCYVSKANCLALLGLVGQDETTQLQQRQCQGYDWLAANLDLRIPMLTLEVLVLV